MTPSLRLRFLYHLPGCDQVSLRQSQCYLRPLTLDTRHYQSATPPPLVGTGQVPRDEWGLSDRSKNWAGETCPEILVRILEDLVERQG